MTTLADSTAPTSSASALSAYQTSGTFNVAYTANDASGIQNVELWYRKNGGAWTLYTTATSSPISFTGTGDGTYDFYTRARDNSAAHNYEAAPGSADRTTIVDTVGPSEIDENL